MPISDLLIAIAQIAVALAGFSGLVAAIRTAAPEGWHPRDIWSLFWMFGASIGALVLALLPLWLTLFEWPEDLVYRASSAVAFLYIATLVTAMAGAGLRLTRRGYPPRIPWFPPRSCCCLSRRWLARPREPWAGCEGRWLRHT